MQREAKGWPAERPKKALRVRGTGLSAVLPETGASVPERPPASEQPVTFVVVPHGGLANRWARADVPVKSLGF